MQTSNRGHTDPTLGIRDEAWPSLTLVAIVCGFATLWAWMGAGALHHGATFVRIAAILVSATLLALRAITVGRNTEGPVNRRLLYATIAGEVVALWILGEMLGRFGRPDLLLPGLAFIVGLHFYPMAKAVGVPAYRVTATAMVIVGLGSVALAETTRTGVTGLACATILWVTIARPLLRSRR